MSEVTIDSSVIKKTQETLGKYVKKPSLSEKLLRKPPFRFLHDVFNAVIRDTGCFEGLYTPEELSIENITDREAKMQFLQKMIDTIKIATNEPLTVKTSKIVAGHEPDKTNELLQLMGVIIDKQIDWKVAVATVINHGAPSNPKPKQKDQAIKEKKAGDKTSPKVNGIKKLESSKDKSKVDEKERTKSKEPKEKTVKKTLRSTDMEKKDDKKTKPKLSSKESTKRSSPEKPKKSLMPEPKPEAKPRSAEKKKQKEKALPEKIAIEKEPIQNEIKISEKDQVPLEKESLSTDSKNDERRASKRAEEILLAAAAENASGTESRRSSGSKRSSGKSRKSSAEKSRVERTDDINGKTSTDPTESLTTVAEEPPPSSQPTKEPIQISEVKRETTFVRENSKEAAQNPSRPRTSLRPPSARPASARPGAPRRRDKNIEIILQPNDNVKLSGVNVKLETFTSELEDDGENLVIIENPNTEDPLGESARNPSKEDTDESMQQGHLVQQILETQKELVHGGTPNTELNKDKEMTKLNSRQTSANHISSLRGVIQNLTKSVNPLGKLMDFIPEDIDAMQLELTMWRDTYNQSSIELKKERSLTESVTEPMKNQLVTIEASIKEYHDMIDECRAKILQNADKIQRLLTTQ